MGKRRGKTVLFAVSIALGAMGCTLLAPSDQELMGGLTKSDEGGAEGGDGSSDARSDARSDGGASDASCGANGASCSGDTSCCSGKCKGNGQCL